MKPRIEMRNATLIAIAIALSACATTKSDSLAQASEEALVSQMNEPKPACAVLCSEIEAEWRRRKDAAKAEYLRRHEGRVVCDKPGQLDADTSRCGFIIPRRMDGTAVDAIARGGD
jgi:hypothetical protein